MPTLRSSLHRAARPRRLVVAALALPLLLASCGDDDGSGGDTTTTSAPSGEAITEAGFHFRDSSVPPEYHRSWTLTVTEDQAYVVVDSYGDVVGEETVDLPPGVWEDVQAGVAALEGDEADDVSDDEACAGGTGAEVWARTADEELFEMDADHCGPGNETVSDRWKEPFAPVLELFDMDTLTAPAE